jgi:lipoate-protein ligase B
MLCVELLGRTGYVEALALQTARVRERRLGTRGDCLLLTEHDPVVTVGRATGASEAPDAVALRAARIALHEASRGGKVTYHGPGQLVGYPIVDLRPRGKDLHRFVECLQAALIRALREMGVAATSCDGLRGVWVDGRKIASIGVAVRGWVTYHGFALNVCGDLSAFDLICPCGIMGVRMTSIAEELPSAPAWNQVQGMVVEAVVAEFGYRGWAASA